MGVNELNFKLQVQAKIRGAFKRLWCCYGNILHWVKTLNCLMMIGSLNDAIVKAAK